MAIIKKPAHPSETSSFSGLACRYRLCGKSWWFGRWGLCPQTPFGRLLILLIDYLRDKKEQ